MLGEPEDERRESQGYGATAFPGAGALPAAWCASGTSPLAPAMPNRLGTFSESASPDGTTISEPRFAMLSYSMFMARRLSAIGEALYFSAASTNFDAISVSAVPRMMRALPLGFG